MTERSGKKRIDLDTTQVAAGGMASVTSAVAASHLGVAGTLVGAGVGSMVGAVAGAVYEHYIDRTRRHVRSVVPRRPAENGRSGGAPTSTDPAAVDAVAPGSDSAGFSLPPLPVPAGERPPAPTGEDQSARSWLRSRRLAIGVSAVAAFGIAVVALTGFEALSGQPISSSGTDDGSTSIGRIFGGNSSPGDTATGPTSTPSPSVTTGDDPASPPATTSETSPAPTVTEPTPTPQPTEGGAQPTSPSGG